VQSYLSVDINSLAHSCSHIYNVLINPGAVISKCRY